MIIIGVIEAKKSSNYNVGKKTYLERYLDESGWEYLGEISDHEWKIGGMSWPTSSYIFKKEKGINNGMGKK